jgi:hypothetical protein
MEMMTRGDYAMGCTSEDPQAEQEADVNNVNIENLFPDPGSLLKLSYSDYCAVT